MGEWWGMAFRVGYLTKQLRREINTHGIHSPHSIASLLK
jgi:hypothetical protein